MSSKRFVTVLAWSAGTASLAACADLDVLGTDLLGVVEQVPAPAQLSLWLDDQAGGERGKRGAQLPRSV